MSFLRHIEIPADADAVVWVLCGLVQWTTDGKHWQNMPLTLRGDVAKRVRLAWLDAASYKCTTCGETHGKPMDDGYYKLVGEELIHYER